MVSNQILPTKKTSALREFFAGALMLIKGFLWFVKQPKAMLLGLIPAAIVGAVLSTLLIVLIFNINFLVGLLSGFADDWVPALAVTLKIAMGAAVIGGTLFLSFLSFTALTLIVGDSFYTKIWREVELFDTGEVPANEPTFSEGLKDGVTLFLKGLIVSLLTFSIGFIPLVGSVLAVITGFALTGYLLSTELSGRAMNARGVSAKERNRFIRGHKFRAIGFGVATQLCFMIPFGAIFAMPAAVVGSTKLSKHMGNFS